MIFYSDIEGAESKFNFDSAFFRCFWCYDLYVENITPEIKEKARNTSNEMFS